MIGVLVFCLLLHCSFGRKYAVMFEHTKRVADLIGGSFDTLPQFLESNVNIYTMNKQGERGENINVYPTQCFINVDIVREKIASFQKDDSDTIELGKCVQVGPEDNLFLAECHHRFIACMIVETKICILDLFEESRLHASDISYLLNQCKKELPKVDPNFNEEHFTWPMHWNSLHYDTVIRGAHEAVLSNPNLLPPPPKLMMLRHNDDFERVNSLEKEEDANHHQPHRYHNIQSDNKDIGRTVRDIENQVVSDIENQIPIVE